MPDYKQLQSFSCDKGVECRSDATTECASGGRAFEALAVGYIKAVGALGSRRPGMGALLIIEGEDVKTGARRLPEIA
jgi:hypothetical protein